MRHISISALLLIGTLAFAQESVTDICGNTYATVQIGDQVWMAENLKCDRYDTQSEAYKAGVTTVTTSKTFVFTPYFADATDKGIWDDASLNKSGVNLTADQIAKLGYLYNWAAAVGVADGQAQTTPFQGKCQGICPNGWHMPSADEWITLKNYIEITDGKGENKAGKHLKAADGWYQDSDSEESVDTYNFTALPAGTAMGNSVSYAGKYAQFWASTIQIDNAEFAAYISLTYVFNDMYDHYDMKDNTHSVRCILGSASPDSAQEMSSESAPAVHKELINGQIVIVAGDRYYNLIGVQSI